MLELSSPLRREDVEREVAIIELSRDFLLSAISESVKLWLQNALAMVQHHNDYASPIKRVNKQSFIGTLHAIIEVNEGAINDLTADLIIDLQRGVEDEEA